MKVIIHKIVSLFLVLLVLGSTTSFSIDKHFCGDHLIDVAIFGEAVPCKMEVALTEKYGAAHIKKSDCCKDEVVVLIGQDELKIQFDQIDIDSLTFLQVFKYSYAHLFDAATSVFVPFDGYPPPLIVTDYQVLYDQYLI